MYVTVFLKTESVAQKKIINTSKLHVFVGECLLMRFEGKSEVKSR